MKKIILITITMITCSSLFGQTPVTDPHWALDWHDEFNFFDTTIWVKGDVKLCTFAIVKIDIENASYITQYN